MANALDTQIMLDGCRNCVVRVSGLIDSSDAFVVPAVSLAQLQTNEQGVTLVGLRMDEAEWSASPGVQLVAEWNSNTPQPMVYMAGQGEIEACDAGGFQPDMTRGGYDGSINFRTLAYVPGTTQSFTVLLKLVKLYR